MWRAVRDEAVSRKPWVVEHADGRVLRAEKRRDQTHAPMRRWKNGLHAELAAACQNRKDAAEKR